MTARAPVDPRLLLTWLGLLFGIAALVLQFVLSMQDMLGNGRDVMGAVGHFLAYYTILTNIVLVLVYLAEILPDAPLALFRRPVVRGMMAANIALVSLYVFFVLRFLTTLEGMPLLADSMLHYLCPALYLIWWLVAQPHGKLRWRHLPLMLVPTLFYFVYVMARGAWVQEYPYPILNALRYGYGQVLLNATYMTLALATLCAAAILLDGFLARLSRTVIQ